jgi:hypothetical protein
MTENDNISLQDEKSNHSKQLSKLTELRKSPCQKKNIYTPFQNHFGWLY